LQALLDWTTRPLLVADIIFNMAHVNGDAPKITLYTNHRCPWAHRAHIVLKELGLKYDEVIIDLDKPREPWYLEINPVSASSSLSILRLTSF
jgi:glutathione S-transferase|tara:strand:- start:16383 stop:16658 length:276 start_codon:yes stop_codon:yes gene_type:complete